MKENKPLRKNHLVKDTYGEFALNFHQLKYSINEVEDPEGLLKGEDI